MFDTTIVIIGNVLTAPEWRRTSTTGSLVANFKVASTSRRLDRETGRWIDGNTLRVRVNCWRKLAEGIASSIMVGDPVVVAGRIYTRDWTDTEGNPRTMYEMEAVAVGHDLARGRRSFRRNRPTLGTSTVEDSEAETQVHGAPAEHLAEEEVPVRYGDGIDEHADFDEVPPTSPAQHDPVVAVRGGGFTPDDMPRSAQRSGQAGVDPGDPLDLALTDDSDAPTRRGLGMRDRPAGRPAPVQSHEQGSVLDVDGGPVSEGGSASETEPEAPRRPRRTGRRIPVPA